jgi:cytochrome b
MGISAMQYHEWSGVAILVLIAFRVAWGLIGGRQSRFSVFVKGPAAVLRYASTLLSKESKPTIGHNPLGGWSILAMLTALFIQAGTGLFANDDILTEGPLYDLVNDQTSDWLTSIHLLNQNILAVLVAIHLGAIVFHLVAKRENLIKPMFTGKKTWENEDDSSWGSPILALFLTAILAIAAWVAIY